MSRTHYLYLKLPLKDLETLVEAHQAEFDVYIGDLFSDEEMTQFEKQLDSIGAIYAQTILGELSFDDFYPDPKKAEEQRSFFDLCRSSICLENLPYFESNPFQVTYLLMLLNILDEALIDRGGVSELSFKEPYVEELRKYKSVDSLLVDYVPKVHTSPKTNLPLSPIDFLIIDVYKELSRLSEIDKVPQAIEGLESKSDKMKKIFQVMLENKLDADSIHQLTGLSPKDFDDSLESLKFFLRKII